MLTYSTIAAGEPASATAMTDHLLTRTLPREVADLARYYTGGRDAAASAEDRTVAELAGEMDKGNLSYSEAISELMLRHADRGADPDDEEARLGERLAQTLERRDFEAAYGPPVAEPRRDMHPLVARGLGLDPDRGVTRDEINALLAGRRADGARIEGKRYAVARQVTDRRTGEVKDLTPIGSVDFCLTPDKSVSVAWAFARPAEQASIYAAHRDAAAEAMAAIEGRIGQARKGDGGRDGADPGHVAWIAFDHYTSRPTLWTARQEDGRTVTESVSVQVPGDPDLHTHFTVPNAVFCENGRVGSLDLDRLDGLIKEAGALYQAHLAANLRRLGAEVVLDDRTGMARLAAIPDHVRDHFSKRTLGGEEAARAYARTLGLDWDALPPERRSGLLKAGVQGTPAGIDAEAREKLRKDDVADFADWRRQARELGWRYEGIEGPRRAGPGPTREERIARAYEAALPWLEKELDRRAVVSGADARTAALRGLIAAGIEETADVGRVTALFRSEGVRQYGEATALVWGRAGERGEVGITTALHAADEAEFMRLARAAAADRTGALRAGEIAAAAGRIGLAFEGEHGEAQRRAMHRLGEGGRLGVVVGAAGSGKTTLLQPLVAAWTGQGRAVHGVALAWRQADDLADAGIAKENVRALSVFLEGAKAGAFVLDRRSVVVVDELGLLGTRQGLELLRLQEARSFRLAMLGDDRQCQAIEAGPIVDLVRRALGSDQVPEILTTVRQRAEREREIAGHWREGRAAEALAMKREDGTAELVPGGTREAVERVAALVGERLRANAGDPSYTLTVSAPTNMDAHRLGVAIREVRRGLGQVGEDQVRVRAADRDGNAYEMALAPGDRVRLFASTRAEGEGGSIGRNGSVLTVLSADAKGMRVRNASGREGRVAWSTLADRTTGRVRLAYGEVMTTHTAQGSTATEHVHALPAGTKAVTGFAAYASGTRHRRVSWLLISAGAEHAEVVRRRPLNDVRPVTETDAWANAARNLGRQPRQEGALEFLARAGEVRRGATRALRHGVRPAERREERGLAPTVLERRLADSRERLAAAPVVARLAEAVRARGALADRLSRLGAELAGAVRERLARLRGPVAERGREGPSMSLHR
ncbi:MULTISPECIES: MobF family relaxase [Roseicella]|uniref:Relaxase domain-containing protein n=2 Tax=Roseicella TaxID=2730923 RepID=A0A9X1IH91_9PROT|nr:MULTISPECIES: MobF family relaxase [Roseicella]MCB4824174.1 relaxase domain-containing protein [Roseicella aerolata]RAI56097.1 aldehyde dehydrogenase [Roseicella frigidaeris]